MNEKEDIFSVGEQSEEDLLDFEFEELSDESGSDIEVDDFSDEEELIELTDIIEPGEAKTDLSDGQIDEEDFEFEEADVDAELIEVEDISDSGIEMSLDALEMAEGEPSEGDDEISESEDAEIASLLAEDEAFEIEPEAEEEFDFDADDIDISPEGEETDEFESELDSALNELEAAEDVTPEDFSDSKRGFEDIAGAGEGIEEVEGDEEIQELEPGAILETMAEDEIEGGETDLDTFIGEIEKKGDVDEGAEIRDKDLDAMINELEEESEEEKEELGLDFDEFEEQAIQEVPTEDFRQVLFEEKEISDKSTIITGAEGVPLPLTQEKLEAVIRDVVEDVVRKVVRETMASTAEKVIRETIEALKSSMELSEK